MFTTLDAEKAFFQIDLDTESSKLLTFNTPYGRYRYLRMPMGIVSAPEKYQAKIEEVFAGLEGTEVIMDDILIWADNEQEHDQRLKAALQRAREKGLKLNRNKCKVKRSQVVYQGHIISSAGLKVDPEKVKAIIDMPEPEDKEGVPRFLGMINYLARYIPHMSEETVPLRELLKKENVFTWEKRRADCFKNLKIALSKAPVLTFYNPDKELVLQVDSSSKGMGATLIQDGHPIAYASRALTPTQQLYAQIEKEMMAIVFGCEKFAEYIIGRPTLIQSDHKPLEAIMAKSLHKAPARLQRMMIRLQRFPEIQVKYTKGKELFLADTLSRAYLTQPVQEAPILTAQAVAVEAIGTLPVSTARLDEIKQATKVDTVSAKLAKYILDGWPVDKSQVDPECRPYWNDHDELTILNGILFKGQCIVIPASLKKDMLDKLHESHMGIVKTKQRARDIMYWPGINHDIENMISSCATCLTYQRQNQREPLKPQPIPSRAWVKVGVDLFSLDGHEYMMCVDYYSKFPYVVKLNNQTSHCVITALKSIFAVQGIAEEIYSDNGPCFSSLDFSKFSQDWNFKHTTSSPRYPRSNGKNDPDNKKSHEKVCRSIPSIIGVQKHSIARNWQVAKSAIT